MSCYAALELVIMEYSKDFELKQETSQCPVMRWLGGWAGGEMNGSPLLIIIAYDKVGCVFLWFENLTKGQFFQKKKKKPLTKGHYFLFPI